MSKPKLAAFVLSIFSVTMLFGASLAAQVSAQEVTAPAFTSIGVTPNTAELTPGDSATIYFQGASDQNDLSIASSCTVNNVDVSSSFEGLTDGLYRVNYTVGEHDSIRAAGMLPISCEIANSTGGTVTVSSFTDGNTVSIAGTTSAVAPAITDVTLEPATGTLHEGDSANVFIQLANQQNDMAIGSSCTVNDVDVAPSLQNLTDGLYRVTYTVGHNDTNRAAGTIPLSCTLASTNDGQTVTATSFIASQDTAIDTTATSTDPDPEPTASSTVAVTAMPASGVRIAGQDLEVYFQATSTATNVTLGGACTVNGVDVSSSFQNLTGGLYKVTYTVGANDTERASGTVPVSCVLNDGTANTTYSAFTDSNTVSIDTNNDGTIGSTGGNGGDNGTSTPSSLISAVGIVPSTGTAHAGENLDVYFNAANDANDITLNGACTVNDVDVSASFQNLTSGLYHLIYPVGANDTERSSGMVPISCMVKNEANATSTVLAFTDSNTLALDVNNDGTIGTTTGTSTGTTTGTIGGDVSGGTEEDHGVLGITSISQTQSQAIADGTFEHGWAWTFNVTVPSDETTFKMKFGNWTNGSNGTIATANNMRISSVQAASTSPVMITGADTYSAPLTITGDMDSNMPGKQIQVKVETQVPAGTVNGSYTTTYGVMSTQ